MAVHHVDMDPVGAGRVDRPHLLAQPGEVGREDRGGDADGLLHRRDPNIRPESRGKEEAPDLSPVNRFERCDEAGDEEAVRPAFGASHGAGRGCVVARSAPMLDSRRGAARKASATCSPSSGSSEQTE